ncbi:uncharacterized protein LOC143660106 [Tamandua tetradactyla]|uniref:uncharacterized protein LOC143660106 n=1 Tax=Tamandua tetradactyla TaxID=48850 RepID=UPI00405415C2
MRSGSWSLNLSPTHPGQGTEAGVSGPPQLPPKSGRGGPASSFCSEVGAAVGTRPCCRFRTRKFAVPGCRPEAMDPPAPPPPAPPPAAAPSPPRHYLLIDKRGVPYKYTAQAEHAEHAEHEERAEHEPGEAPRKKAPPFERCTCPECGRLCYSRDQLRRHRVSHSTLKPFACATCGRTFKRATELTQHRSVAHDCGLCTRRFQNAAALAKHACLH